MLSQYKINSYNKQLQSKKQEMQQKQEVQRVKMICLKDKNNKQEKYMLLQNYLGKGRYGKVYKAVNVDDPNKIFAVKVIRLQSEKVRQQCSKQLQIIRRLPKSLNLVQIHSQHLQSDNNFYLFQEYCDGGNLLQQKINRKGKPYTQQQVFNLFFQIVNGFLDLRKANIFHEDIKPANILIKNNLYKLTDFGISQLLQKLQASQLRRGTLVYMPPQKLKGATFTPNSKTQIYSLGVSLFEVIYGYHPYLRKKPQDYKHYLKLLQQSQLKSAQQLKNYFPSPSLCIDKLIRTLLRMIDLSQAKRLSLEQLQDYMKNTEPFKSMIVSEIEPIAKRKSQKTVKYQTVGISQVIVQSQNGMGDLLVNKLTKSQKQKHKIKQIQINLQKQKQSEDMKKKMQVDLFKVCFQLIRDSSGYIQQGLVYGRQTKMSQLNKIRSPSPIQLQNVSKITQIQFISLLFIQRMLNQIQRAINAYIFQSDSQGCQELNLGIEADKQFISNEFLKLFMDIQCEDKKKAWTIVKQMQNQIGSTISKQLLSIFSQINCVRINFKQDMLLVLWIKEAPTVFEYLKKIIDTITQRNIQQLLKTMESPQYEKVKNILIQFSQIERLKTAVVRQRFAKCMKGHEILQDIQSNSDDQYQILDPADLLV